MPLLAIVLTLALALALVAAGPARAVVPVSPSCSALLVVGLRGSGEPYSPGTLGMGPTVRAAYGQIARRVTGTRGYGLDYPAGPATSATLTNGAYRASVEAGTRRLKSFLVAEAGRCPRQRVALVGYSQGAQAAGDVLATLPPRPAARIGYVLLFGDPTANPALPIARGTSDRTAVGALGARELGRRWLPITASYCLAGDFVCALTDAAATACDFGLARSCPHYGYLRSGLAVAGGAAAGQALARTPSGSPKSQSPRGRRSGGNKEG